MKCGYCGLDFAPEEGKQACRACTRMSGCHMIACPKCGYEMPPESRIATWIRKALTRGNGPRT